MKKFGEIIWKSIYLLTLWVWGVIFIVHNKFEADSLGFNFRFVTKQKLLLEIIISAIAIAILVVAAYFIAKKFKVKKLYNVVLITLAVITGSQAIVWYLGLNKWFF